jgi:hypothetical protein
VTAQDVLDLASRMGIRLRADGPRLRWRCRGPLPSDLRDLLVAHKPGLLAALQGYGPCQKCGRAPDEKGRCWNCFDRPCVGCGRPTGSAYIATCLPCGSRSDAPTGREGSPGSLGGASVTGTAEASGPRPSERLA